MKNTVFYHANCMDGMAAAYAAYLKLGDDCEYIALRYSDTIPFDACEGRTVYFLDFSCSRSDFLKIREIANKVVVLDHHKSAAEELAGLVEMDMDKSGAVLAWEYFHPDKTIPTQYLYIQDRDLWRWEYGFTKAFGLAAWTYPITLDGFSQVMETDLTEMISAGEAISRHHDQQVAAVTKNTRRFTLDEWDVPVLNINHALVSDALALLKEGESFAVGYSDIGDRRLYSLRSSPDGEDVSVIAKRFGGGGHKNASGFNISFDDPRMGLSHISLSSNS